LLKLAFHAKNTPYILFLTFVLLVTVSFFLLIKDFLLACFWAIILAVVFDPVYQRFKQYVKNSEILALFLTMMIILVFVIPLLSYPFVIPLLSLCYPFVDHNLDDNGGKYKLLFKNSRRGNKSPSLFSKDSQASFAEVQ
jgi:predicted PurR-regulated permease PerM